MIIEERIKEVDQKVQKQLKEARKVPKVMIPEMQKENLRGEVSLKKVDPNRKDQSQLNQIKRAKVERELKGVKVPRAEDNQNHLNQ